MNKPRQEADAFDDLLGQLVDELAMTPTNEPSHSTGHAAIPGGTVVVPAPAGLPDPAANIDPAAGSSPLYPVQKQANLLPWYLLSGSVLVVGLAFAVLWFLKDDPPPPAPPQPTIIAQPVTPVPAAPGAHQVATPTAPAAIDAATKPEDAAAKPGEEAAAADTKPKSTKKRTKKRRRPTRKTPKKSPDKKAKTINPFG